MVRIIGTYQRYYLVKVFPDNASGGKYISHSACFLTLHFCAVNYWKQRDVPALVSMNDLVFQKLGLWAKIPFVHGVRVVLFAAQEVLLFALII